LVGWITLDHLSEIRSELKLESSDILGLRFELLLDGKETLHVGPWMARNFSSSVAWFHRIHREGDSSCVLLNEISDIELWKTISPSVSIRDAHIPLSAEEEINSLRKLSELATMENANRKAAEARSNLEAMLFYCKEQLSEMEAYISELEAEELRRSINEIESLLQQKSEHLPSPSSRNDNALNDISGKELSGKNEDDELISLFSEAERILNEKGRRILARAENRMTLERTIEEAKEFLRIATEKLSNWKNKNRRDPTEEEITPETNRKTLEQMLDQLKKQIKVASTYLLHDVHDSNRNDETMLTRNLHSQMEKFDTAFRKFTKQEPSKKSPAKSKISNKGISHWFSVLPLPAQLMLSLSLFLVFFYFVLRTLKSYRQQTGHKLGRKTSTPFLIPFFFGNIFRASKWLSLFLEQRQRQSQIHSEDASSAVKLRTSAAYRAATKRKNK